MDEAARPRPRVYTSNLTPGISPDTYSAAGGTPSWKSGPSPSPTPHQSDQTPCTPLPPPVEVTPRSLTERESQLVKHLSRLQFFLATAPTRWMGSEDSPVSNSPFHPGPLSSPHPNLNRFLLPNGEHVACVFWNGLYHITGTDIVRALIFRFEAFSRPVRNMKKFEEGVFSDLRNLKPGTDACLEEPKSPFLDLLFRSGCIRTQKKQKVFYWFSVPHDRLFLDALERDLKREKMGLEPTTVVVGEPARSFSYDPKQSLFEQFAGNQPGLEESVMTGAQTVEQTRVPERSAGSEDPIVQIRTEACGQVPSASMRGEEPIGDDTSAKTRLEPGSVASPQIEGDGKDQMGPPTTANSVLFSRSLFEGSPTYKQRRKKSSRDKRVRQQRGGTASSNYDTGDEESASDSEGFHRSEYSFAPSHEENNMHTATMSHTNPAFFDDNQESGRAAPAGPGGLRGTSDPAEASEFLHSITNIGGLHQSSSTPWSHLGIPVSGENSNVTIPTFPSFEVPGHAILNSQPNVPPAPGAQGKGFSCPLLSCGRLFKRLEHLKRHVRTHTQERPYECTRCSKRFSRSDNLTQHIKTHEKADRGERMKTEASESTEDDMATYLEAEVDAMATRDHIPFLPTSDNKASNRDIPYRYSMSEEASVLSDSALYSPGRAQATQTPQNMGISALLSGVRPFHRGSSTSSDWSAIQGQLGSSFGGGPLVKRHRSLTPSLPISARGSLGLNGQAHQTSWMHQPRYHPYAPSPGPVGGVGALDYPSNGVQRASSLGPNTFANRTSQFARPFATDQPANHDPLDYGLLNNLVHSESSFLSGATNDLTIVPGNFEGNLNIGYHDGVSAPNGLKEGADGDLVAGQRLNGWTDGT